MDVGMLWLDDDKKTSFDEKIIRAADYYQSKYGLNPELCLVNQSMLAKETHVGKIQVLPAQNVLPHHFWIGMKSS